MKLTIKCRDDGEPQFKDERDLEHGPDANLHLIFYARRMGRYRTRQYEITVVDDTQPFALVAMIEDVETHNR